VHIARLHHGHEALALAAGQPVLTAHQPAQLVFQRGQAGSGLGIARHLDHQQLEGARGGGQAGGQHGFGALGGLAVGDGAAGGLLGQLLEAQMAGQHAIDDERRAGHQQELADPGQELDPGEFHGQGGQAMAAPDWASKKWAWAMLNATASSCPTSAVSRVPTRAMKLWRPVVK
jgi:hypothetical protein